MTIGAGIGFVFGIIFTIMAAIQIDPERGTVADAINVGVFIGMPILVVMGTFAGWLWDVFMKPKP